MTPPVFEGLGLITQGDDAAWAVTTSDNAFRYVLGRSWDPELPPWVFAMLNPSKARHDVEDHTMRKCVGFAQRGGGGSIAIVNLFAYSATDPDDMCAAHRRGVNVVGEHNQKVLDWALDRRAVTVSGGRGLNWEQIAALATGIRPGCNVAAWGKVPASLRQMAGESIRRVRESESFCFGTNKDGSPKHPLMLAYETKLERYCR